MDRSGRGDGRGSQQNACLKRRSRGLNRFRATRIGRTFLKGAFLFPGTRAKHKTTTRAVQSAQRPPLPEQCPDPKIPGLPLYVGCDVIAFLQGWPEHQPHKLSSAGQGGPQLSVCVFGHPGLFPSLCQGCVCVMVSDGALPSFLPSLLLPCGKMFRFRVVSTLGQLRISGREKREKWKKGSEQAQRLAASDGSVSHTPCSHSCTGE